MTVKRNIGNWGAFLRIFSFFFLSLLFSEVIINFFALGFKSGFPVFMLLFSVSVSVLLAACTLLFKGIGRTAFMLVCTVFLLLLSAVQLVYHHIFGSFLSISQLGMGKDALTSFGKEALIGVTECLFPLFLLILPTAALLILCGRNCFTGGGTFRFAAIMLLVFVLLHFCTVLALPLGGSHSYAPADIYHDTFVLDMSVRDFGLLTSLRLEIKHMLFPKKDQPVVLISDETQSPAPVVEPDEHTAQKIYADNVTDIDFDALIAAETDEQILTLHRYFAAKQPTKQNDYTGMFKDFNLILLCCESFSPYLIASERTPTLYKMATEGFIFTDYYNTVCDNTSNGEYSLCTGLLPDFSLLGRGWSNFYDYNSFTVSKGNYLPFCFGNQFRKQGAVSMAIHNYFCDYYGRDKTHPNMGYDFKAIFKGLNRTDDWPTSDVSMMEQTLPLLLASDADGNIPRFHAYYLTFSGHMYYNFTSNDMAIKNKSVTDSLPYSTAVKAYISCQQELEYALDYMVEQLDAAGVLDKTLIVLTADHYPYNLGLEKLQELSGEPLDEEFDKYRSALLMWTPAMTEPVQVDVPCCTLDILPTVSNLLGLEYDSRLLAGSDIFSDAEHIAILADRSFVTDKVYYNCFTDTAVPRDGELPDGYLDAKINLVKNKFAVSVEILYSDYYSYLYPKQ